MFSLADLCTELGIAAFTDGRVTPETFLLAPLFRPAGPGLVTPVHSVFGEHFAARVLRTEHGRAAAATGTVVGAEPLVTEQVRRFLRHVDVQAPAAAALTLPAGVYLVGPSHRLLLRNIDAPVVFDEFPVTVGWYKVFLAAVERQGCAAANTCGHGGPHMSVCLLGRQARSLPAWDGVLGYGQSG